MYKIDTVILAETPALRKFGTTFEKGIMCRAQTDNGWQMIDNEK